MRTKAVAAYAVLLLVVFMVHLFPSRAMDYLLPLYMIAVPLSLGRRLKFSVSLRQLQYTFYISLVILVPAYAILSINGSYHLPAASVIVAQLVRIALPEEIFFRGFLQEIAGNNLRGILIVSLLFAGAHIPAYIFYQDTYALLTFFPSLVMGFLYMRTSSILPPAVFHSLANVVFRGFVI